MVVLKAGLAHSYVEIHCLNQSGAFDNRGQSRNRCYPERALLLWWEGSAAARRQAQEGSERESTQRDRQQCLAKYDRYCCTAN